MFKSLKSKILVGLSVIVLSFGSYTYFADWKEYETTIKVTSGERVCEKGASDCEFRIYTANNMTYTNNDNLWKFKWRSADLQGYLLEGGCFDITYTGFRSGMFSLYPNIITAEKCVTDLPEVSEGKEPRQSTNHHPNSVEELDDHSTDKSPRSFV